VATQNRRKLMIIAVIVLVIAIILSLFVYLNTPKSYSGNLVTVSIGVLAHESNSLIYIADEQQYFAANGIKVNYVNYSSGLSALNGLQNGESDFGVASEFVLVRQSLQNLSLCTFASIAKAESFYLVARTDRGIKNISDLKGETLGVLVGTNEEFFLGRFLELNGISQSEVTLRNIPIPEAPSALANGTVNAVISLQPYLNQITNLVGDKAIIWPVQSEQVAYNDAVCTKTWATNNPDLIIRFLKALTQAETFSLNHKDQAMATVTKALNYTSAYIASVWPDYQFSVSLDQAQLLAMQDEATWLISNNLTNATELPNFLNYVYLDGLEAVDPNAVTIIH
jgi:ABC-type nitrate/sulfonate/bicarbonate transport system substrate-binding protein